MADETLLLLHLESPSRGAQGDSIYRTLQPCRALGERQGLTVVSGSWLSPEAQLLAPEADLLVLCDVVEADLLPVVAARRARGLPTIYEINDDFLSPQPWSPTAYLAENPLLRSLSSLLASRCDGLQFTVAELERRFGHLNARRAVFHNQLWEAPAEAPKPPWLRVGWGGSLGHLEDLRAVLPALRGLLARHPEATLCLMAADEFRPLVSQAGLPAGRVELQRPGSLAHYYAFVASLHIGLCPLQDTDFNRCRSDVKFLEYAAHGVAPICADRAPYRETVVPGETGLLFGSAAELEAQLERLAGDRALCERLAAQAARSVRTQRLERLRIGDRLAFWRSAAAGAGAPLLPRSHRSEALAGLAHPGALRALPAGGFTALGGALEALLYRGLQAARDPVTRDEALRCFAEASRLAPGFAQPLLFAGRSEPDPARAVALLERAALLAPRSCAAQLLLAERLREAGDREAAAQALLRCEALAPDLGAAQAALAELAEERGDRSAAALHQRRAREQNRFLAGPTLRLALWALEEARPAEAEALLRELQRVDDRLWQGHFLLGRALVEQGRWAEGAAALERSLPRAQEPAAVLVWMARAQVGLGNEPAARFLLAEVERLRARR